MFKFLGHSQFLEIGATSKEVVLFRDNAFVLLRFTCGFNKCSIHDSYSGMLWLTNKFNVYTQCGSSIP